MSLEKTKLALRECIRAIHTRGPGPREQQLGEALAECLAVAPDESEPTKIEHTAPGEYTVTLPDGDAA